MIDTQALYPGCKVRIVDKWVEPYTPPMEPWRGKTMTVRRLINPHDIVMEETGDGLIWFPSDIEEIIGEIVPEFDFVFSQESLIDFML